MLVALLVPRRARHAWCDSDSRGWLLYKHFWDLISDRILTHYTLPLDCDHITAIHRRVSSTASGVMADVKPARSWLSSVRRVRVLCGGVVTL